MRLIYILLIQIKSKIHEIENILSEANISFRGIPINHIPDWEVCQSLLYFVEKNDNSKLIKVCALWPDIFTEMKDDDAVEITIDTDMPSQLQRICIALKRRLKPILMKDDVQNEIRRFDNEIKQQDVKDEKQRIFEKWSEFDSDIDVSMIVEEDALPVNPFNN